MNLWIVMAEGEWNNGAICDKFSKLKELSTFIKSAEITTEVSLRILKFVAIDTRYGPKLCLQVSFKNQDRIIALPARYSKLLSEDEIQFMNEQIDENRQYNVIVTPRESGKGFLYDVKQI